MFPALFYNKNYSFVFFLKLILSILDPLQQFLVRDLTTCCFYQDAWQKDKKEKEAVRSRGLIREADKYTSIFVISLSLLMISQINVSEFLICVINACFDHPRLKLNQRLSLTATSGSGQGLTRKLKWRHFGFVCFYNCLVIVNCFSLISLASCVFICFFFFSWCWLLLSARVIYFRKSLFRISWLREATRRRPIILNISDDD